MGLKRSSRKDFLIVISSWLGFRLTTTDYFEQTNMSPLYSSAIHDCIFIWKIINLNWEFTQNQPCRRLELIVTNSSAISLTNISLPNKPIFALVVCAFVNWLMFALSCVNCFLLKCWIDIIDPWWRWAECKAKSVLVSWSCELQICKGTKYLPYHLLKIYKYEVQIISWDAPYVHQYTVVLCAVLCVLSLV